MWIPKLLPKSDVAENAQRMPGAICNVRGVGYRRLHLRSTLIISCRKINKRIIQTCLLAPQIRFENEVGIVNTGGR
jgi:hypothetical protein